MTTGVLCSLLLSAFHLLAYGLIWPLPRRFPAVGPVAASFEQGLVVMICYLFCLSLFGTRAETAESLLMNIALCLALLNSHIAFTLIFFA